MLVWGLRVGDIFIIEVGSFVFNLYSYFVRVFTFFLCWGRFVGLALVSRRFSKRFLVFFFLI